MFDEILQRRDFSGILVGGGSPCQGNTSLNVHRGGLSDHRTLLARHIPRIAEEIRARPGAAGVPVFEWLENVYSAPQSVRSHYNDLMRTWPILIDAAIWGYTGRKRLLWLSGPSGGLQDVRQLKLPDKVTTSWDERGWYVAHWSGKPVPSVLNIKNGYGLDFSPADVVHNAGRGAMYPFTREFYHPTDQTSGVSKVAVKRFFDDNRRFPPGAYEDHCIVWKAGAWRTLDHEERCEVMCWPVGCVEGVQQQTSHQHFRATANSLGGNGLHLPTIMLAFVLLLQTASGCVLPGHLPYARMESDLRGLVANTVWQPGFVESFPGVLMAEQLWGYVRSIFHEPQYHRLPWTSVGKQFVRCNVVFAVLHGGDPLEHGPGWVAQRLVAQALQALGTQRAASSSTRGLHPLLPPGLGPSAHMQQAFQLANPFNSDAVVDMDVDFVAQASARLGPYWYGWVRQQRRAFDNAFPGLCSQLMLAS